MGQLISDLEQRLARLDAQLKKSTPGQLGLDLTEAASGGAGGQACGQGWIPKSKTCHKGAGQAGYRPTPQIREGISAKPMSINTGGDSSFDPKAEKQKAAGGLKYYRSQRGGSTKQNYFFRDRQAAEHWYADHNAKSDADIEVGTANRRGKEWQAEYRASYEGTRNLLRDVGDRELLETVQSYAAAGSATSRGTATDVRIGGNTHSRPIREGTFTKTAAPVLTNPDRTDPGLAPKAKPQGLSAQDVISSKQQGEFARQQQAAAKAAGDQRGAAAWREQERKAEKARLQGAMQRKGQSQTSLFGVTEYDESMPLFGRRDSEDRVSRLLGQVLAEYLPLPQMIEWDVNQAGTHGRVASEGLLYAFRCDAEGVSYRPAWDGINERQWECRSEGFLQARYPETRLDFKFQQKRSKRKCSKGYGCGSSCISMNKECRVQAKSAMSKARLRALQALAMEGDAKAAEKAKNLQLQRDATAQKLKGDRQVGKLKKMLEDPRIAEMVRTGKLPEADGKAEQGAPKAGDVRNVKPDGIEVDPDRFQYKIGASASGEVGSLSGVRRWDPNLAGVISVWQDPADGKTYVVNGHNRLALARRLGAENVTVRYLDAPDARTARAIGAKQNIAEGAGTEVDAAKFFRDTGIKTMQQVEEQGLPLRSGKAEKGLALARLPEEMFQDVVQGRLRMRQAALIGASGLDEDKQREVYKVVKKNPKIQDETLGEYVEQLAFSERQKQTSLDLFGESETSVDTGLARADLTKSIKKSLSQEARLLASVSKSQKAVEILQEKGGNVINVGQSQEKAGEANTVLRLFDQLKLSAGPISSALNQAAARVTNGESRSVVLKELRELVIQGMDEELTRLGLKSESEQRNEAPTLSMFDASDRFDAVVERLIELSDRMDRRCVRPDGTFYGTKGKCRQGKDAGARRSQAARPAKAARQAKPAEPAGAEPEPPAKAGPAPAGRNASSAKGGSKGFRATAKAAGKALVAALVAQWKGEGGALKQGARSAANRLGLRRAADQPQTGKLAGGQASASKLSKEQEIERGQLKNIIKSAADPDKLAATLGMDLDAPHLRDLKPALQEATRAQQAESEAVRKSFEGKKRPWKVAVKQRSLDGEERTIHVDVALDEPIQWGRRTVGDLSLAVMGDNTNANSKLARDLRDQGLLKVDGPLGGLEAFELSFGIGTYRQEARAGYSRQELPGRVGRRLAFEVSRQMGELVKSLPDGTLVQASAWSDDGLGEKRQSLYERAGFTFGDDLVGLAVVHGGKIQRLRKDGRYDSEDLDLTGLIEGLIALGGPGPRPRARTDAAADRLDAAVTRLVRLNAKAEALAA
jgi:hypothetical protein